MSPIALVELLISYANNIQAAISEDQINNHKDHVDKVMI